MATCAIQRCSINTLPLFTLSDIVTVTAAGYVIMMMLHTLLKTRHYIIGLLRRAIISGDITLHIIITPYANTSLRADTTLNITDYYWSSIPSYLIMPRHWYDYHVQHNTTTIARISTVIVNAYYHHHAIITSTTLSSYHTLIPSSVIISRHHHALSIANNWSLHSTSSFFISRQCFIRAIPGATRHITPLSLITA